MKSGVELIAEERQEQLEKHGLKPEHDDEYTKGELIAVALCIISNNYCKWPEGWSLYYMEKFMAKKGTEALKVAGALIAAEIDRLQRIKPQMCYKTNEPCQHNCHGQCKESC